MRTANQYKTWKKRFGSKSRFIEHYQPEKYHMIQENCNNNNSKKDLNFFRSMSMLKDTLIELSNTKELQFIKLFY